MKKVISFSLWGDNPTYTIGAIINAELAKIYYPDFECWFYIHQETVPEEIINELTQLRNTKVILKTGDLSVSRPMMWRFEAIDEPDVEIMMSRDTDTRFLLREKLAVQEWLESGKTFHIMRDHPHHTFTILGGMFGTRKISNISSWKIIINNINQASSRDYDQTFLNQYIYPHINNDSLVHSSFTIHPGENAKPFPIPYCKDYKFVGEYVYQDESRSKYHIDELIKNID